MPNFYRLCAGVAVLLAVTSFARANETYRFDSAHSTIAFEVHHFVGTANGKFRTFSGTIDLDGDHPENSSVSVRIEVGSIDTGIRKRDDHLRSEEFFNVAKFPDITFKSRRVKQTGQQSADVTGDFTMHGVTKPIVLHVKLVGRVGEKNSRWQVTTDAINRRDFGLMFNGTAEAVSGIGKEVAVRIEIEAGRQN